MSNVFSNRVAATLTPAAITSIKASVAAIKAQMPFLIGATIEERQTMPKISEVNRVFTSDALVSVQNNGQMLPAYFQAAELSLDYKLYEAIDEVAFLVAQLAELISDTQMIAGSEAYVTSLTAYRLFGAAAAAGVPGADAVYEALKARFARQGGNAAPAPPAEPGV